MPLVLASAATISRAAVTVSSAVDALFPAGSVGQAAEHVALELRNDGPGTLTGGRLFITADPAGGGYAVAVLDPVARDRGYAYAPSPAGGAYASPTDASTGLILPDLPSGQKCLIGLRRDLSIATVPPGGVENNSVRASFTAPITYA